MAGIGTTRKQGAVETGTATQQTGREIHAGRKTFFTRWFIRQDVVPAVAIDSDSADGGWDEDDLHVALKPRNAIGMVVEDELDRLCEFMVYEFTKNTIEIKRFSVGGCFRRLGAGSALMAVLKKKMQIGSVSRTLVWDVQDCELETHLFLRHHGWIATGILSSGGCTFYRFKFEGECTGA